MYIFVCLCVMREPVFVAFFRFILNLNNDRRGQYKRSGISVCKVFFFSFLNLPFVKASRHSADDYEFVFCCETRNRFHYLFAFFL